MATKKKTKQKSRGSNKKAIVVVAVVLVLAIVYFLMPHPSQQWTVNKDGILSYPENRGTVEVKVLKAERGGNYTLETISFESKDYTVEGLFRIPSSGKKMPAVVILPGATVPKEGTQTLAAILSGMGYASLGIEQRNRGGVDFQKDFALFKNGKEPIEHMMVFDALRAVDVLRQDSRIDAERIAIVGESNGGRFAILAAAIDPSIAGVIGISTSGYDTESEIGKTSDEMLKRFYLSIDPDTYLDLIPPRKLVMIHSVNDNIIPIGLAENTFRKAKEPKQFYRVPTGSHGYSDGMRDPLEKELKLILQ